MHLTQILFVCVLCYALCVRAESRTHDSYNLERSRFGPSVSPSPSVTPTSSASPSRTPTTSPTPSASITPWTSTTQTWSRTLGTGLYNAGSQGFAGIQTSDGGYVVVGSSIGMSLSKWDSTGSLIWSIVGGDWETQAAAVVQTTDGGYAVCGTTYISNGMYPEDYVLLAKFASNGTLEWARTYGAPSSEFCRSAQQTSDGGYILLSYYEMSGDFSVLAIKTQADGTLTWAKNIIGPFPARVAEASDGGYVFTGMNYTESENQWTVIAGKLSAAGDLVWSVTLGAGSEWGSIQPTSDGGFIVARSFGNREPGLTKLTATGAVSWSKSIPVFATSSTIADGVSAQQTSDGGYVLGGAMYVGEWNSPDEYIGQFLSKWGADGSLSWVSFVGTPRNYGLLGTVQQTSDGGYFTTGTLWDDIWISKWNSLGRISSDCASYLDLTASDVTITPGNLPVTAVDITLTSSFIDFAVSEVEDPLVGYGCVPLPSPSPNTNSGKHNVLIQ